MSRTLLLSLSLSGLCLAQPLTPEAFVKLQTLSEGCVSPDGQVLAYTVCSETPEDPHFHRRGERSQNRVCLFEEGQERVLLENAFAPSWSPDGQALALLDADASEARLKVWWRKNGTWAVLRHASLGFGGGPGYLWTPRGTLLVATRLAGPEKSDVTVLDSTTVTPQPRHALVEWNPDTGTRREWAQGVFSHFSPAPDGQLVAALHMGELSFPATARSGPGAQLVLLDGSGKLRKVEGISNPRPDSLQWSADASQLTACDEFGHWWQIRGQSGQAVSLGSEVTDCCWVGNRLARRSDAWRLEDKPLLPASARFFNSPSRLLAVADGRVYQLDAGAEPQVLGQLPGTGTVTAQTTGWPVLLKQGSQRSLLTSTGEVVPLPSGAQQFFAAGTGKVWLSNPEHTRLQTLDGQKGPQLATPESGDRLVSLPAAQGSCDFLLLPPVDRPGPYPTVVWLKPGGTYTPEQPPEETLLSNKSGGLNARLLSAQGYAVFFPSLPEGQGEPANWLDKELNAALLRLGKERNADLNRLAVMGQGYGGYATLLASTQSHPFKAAIALGAYGDLSGDYARLSPATRLAPAQDALPFVHRQSHYYEKGQPGMGRPPWQDPQLWVRNSPYYQAGRVQLPVLLISGGQDGHLPQAEQFFTALYRQGKPARLVRYQDESQTIGRADHVIDQWRQIHSWLARYLGDAPVGQANP